ncbi:acetoacetate decarboxylase family protein [Roseovarius sp. ZX-A-9]|uniref:acetoacetate decarboxylase family protein n=1 Tax=Roseovarius sp. ZX-A-9 TaxID=3014783 RepID=UPI00232B335F|nr:acetoacetate decarboxylase family protein [Roseovarius sp. ZX-A-9]
MPVQAPLIPDPFVPYECPDNVTLSVLCRADPALLQSYLAPVPYTPLDDRFVVYASDFSNCNKCRFMDAGIIVPVEFEGRQGATYLFEYEDNDEAIAAGRDLWGYPKKFADITLETVGDKATARVTRKGTDILTIHADFTEDLPLDMPKLAPHFNMHVQPGPDGKVLSRRIIERDTSPDFQLKSTRTGQATVSMASIENDPLGEFAPIEILGVQLIRGDFFATEKNGWGRTIKTL